MIPTFQELMLPVLLMMADEVPHSMRDILDRLAKKFHVSSEERKKITTAGGGDRFYTNVNWACVDLYQAKMLSRISRGIYQITALGKEELKKNHTEITRSYLRSISTGPYWDSMDKPRRNVAKNKKESVPEVPLEKNPEESIDDSFQMINAQMVSELQELLKSCTPAFFEHVVVDLLLAMGYGGSRQEAQVVGKSGDGGIDGVIKEDKLGLDAVYVQAKRYGNTVPIGQVRDFAGAMMSRKAKKGVIITTSQFPKEAHNFVSQVDMRIVLIDGQQLANLMIEHNVGVSVWRVYEYKRIDSDYFEEAEV